jgi:fructan beta-fructosidase
MKKLIHFLLFLLLVNFSCKQASVAEKPDTTYYQQAHRPQFHFSPEANWMNDPNGMVFYEGEYHLFYQYYPDSTVWGPMHWGHTISSDLVHWEHMPIALYPDSLGYIFSGSAVVDWKNTSGLGKGDHPPLIAIFTHHDMKGERSGSQTYQYQSIAYSNDKGRNWTKYEGNPVLPNPGIRDFRDPKVFWHEPSAQWVMIFAAADHVRIYNSPDLKAWSLASEFGKESGSHGGVWECPDLFELKTKSGLKKWVMIVSIGNGAINAGSGTQYFIGDFDGKTFTNNNPADMVLWLDYGRDNYAGVTWSDIPAEDGRRLFMGWMSNWAYATVVPTETWRSAMTIARELRLEEYAEGLRVSNHPVKEMENIRGVKFANLKKTLVSESLVYKSESALMLEATFEFASVPEKADFGFKLVNEKGEELRVGYNSDSSQYYIDRTKSGKLSFSDRFAKDLIYASREHTSNHVKMQLFIDRSSIELFADDGRYVMTNLFFPNSDFNRIEYFEDREYNMDITAEMFELKSIW